MFSFFIKKTFFDMWDNLLAMFLLNVGFVFLVCGFFILPAMTGITGTFLIFYVAAGVVVIAYYTGGVFRFTLDLSDNKRGGLVLFFKHLIGSWKQNLVSCVLALVLAAAALVAIPSYLLADSMVLVIIGGIMFWAWFTAFLASLFFPPASVRLKKKVFSCLRDSFSFVFDNLAFCLAVFFFFLITLAVSALLFFMLPGPATALLWINVCFKIRLYKYEYLRTHPGTAKRDIPWDELIAEDRNMLGKRTLRGMIFPWRE
ncbi:MAG: hypothetical protein JXD23_02980 [Spirochaetales bacterium]|nr:hypothetical protein [Spirochaetales bacterium]